MFDMYAQTEKNVKEFVMEELNDARRLGKSSYNFAVTREAVAYGALQFATNYCFPSYNYELADWWEKEILPEFKKIFE